MTLLALVCLNWVVLLRQTPGALPSNGAFKPQTMDSSAITEVGPFLLYVRLVTTWPHSHDEWADIPRLHQSSTSVCTTTVLNTNKQNMGEVWEWDTGAWVMLPLTQEHTSLVPHASHLRKVNTYTRLEHTVIFHLFHFPLPSHPHSPFVSPRATLSFRLAWSSTSRRTILTCRS